MSPKSKSKSKAKSKFTPKPSYQKARPASSPSVGTNATAALPVASQQLLLNIFRDTFASSPGAIYPGQDRDLATVVQEIKGLLYARDFIAAFGRSEYLRAYAARWSAARALCYAGVFCDVLALIVPGRDAFDGAVEAPVALSSVSTSDEREEQEEQQQQQQQPQTQHQRQSASDRQSVQIVCIGGGAGAELVGLAGAIGHSSVAAATSDPHDNVEHSPPTKRSPPAPEYSITAMDIADWSEVINTLTTAVTSSPTLSAYASASAQAANRPLVLRESFTTSFLRRDVLEPDTDQATQPDRAAADGNSAPLITTPRDFTTLLSGARLVTIMFTLNELYTASIPRTQSFLQRLTNSVTAGCLLLVVDSPGSYSEVTLGNNNDKGARKYPMHWLLDHALIPRDDSGSKNEADRAVSTRWEKLRTVESEWFRVPEGLKYPIPLENMRYQLHLYCKT